MPSGPSSSSITFNSSGDSSELDRLGQLAALVDDDILYQESFGMDELLARNTNAFGVDTERHNIAGENDFQEHDLTG